MEEEKEKTPEKNENEPAVDKEDSQSSLSSHGSIPRPQYSPIPNEVDMDQRD